MNQQAWPDFLAGGSETDALMRRLDRSGPSSGDPEPRPQSLCSAVGLLLNSKFAMLVSWRGDPGFARPDKEKLLGCKGSPALPAAAQEWATP